MHFHPVKQYELRESENIRLKVPNSSRLCNELLPRIIIPDAQEHAINEVSASMPDHCLRAESFVALAVVTVIRK